MICRLCLKDSEYVLKIFDITGYELGIARIIGKHFWFEPRNDDAVNSVICNSCWIKVNDFHEFYCMVESSHRNFVVKTEGSIVKTESSKTKRRPSLNDLITFSSLPSKREPDDEFGELGEVPFNMLIDDTTDEPLVEKAAAIALGGDDISTNGYSNDDFDEDEDYIRQTDDKDKFSSHNDVSFDGEAFMKDILTSNSSPKKESSSSSSDQRTTRSSKNKLKISEKLKSKIEITDDLDIKKRRGRPRKNDQVISKKVRNIQQKRRNVQDKTDDIYKSKMREIDVQISQYMALHCEVCNGVVENFAGLRTHMRTEHNIKRGYAKCCNKKFLKRALLLDHIRQHLDPECYRCEECSRVFADRQSMRNHFLIKHQKEEDKKFECPECSKKFVKKYLLEHHKVFTHRDRTTTCKKCNRRFDTAKELIEHNKEHCNYGTMCDICAKVIRGPAAFKRHQLEHQGITFPKVQCDLCGSWHKDKYALNKHKKRHLESKQPQICDICNKISPSRSAMLSHKRYVHGTDRNYECGVCRKSFKKALSLKEHMTTHTGEVLYRCPHCPKTFNSNANMHSHRKKAHPREFEETRKLRKQNAHLNDQPVPPISVLSNAKKDTQALLVIGTDDESHNVLITTTSVEEVFSDEDITDLSKRNETSQLILYSI